LGDEVRPGLVCVFSLRVNGHSDGMVAAGEGHSLRSPVDESCCPDGVFVEGVRRAREV
jgi:hypothetical protein